MMNSGLIVSVDIGGTKVNVGAVQGQQVTNHHRMPFCASASADEIIAFLIGQISGYVNANTDAIALGVPCIVDVTSGTVIDAVNIPAWQHYPLKSALERHFSLPVYINNDVNCFAVGEHQFGVGKLHQDIIGLCLGTGIGAGIIMQNNLYQGQNCAAGEIGSVPYLDTCFDDYCSGKFFLRLSGMPGYEVAQKAKLGDEQAIVIFQQFGEHLARAISYLLLMFDPQLIVLGGSVAQSFTLFEQSLWQGLQKHPYQTSVSRLKIALSLNENAALLGAAHLCQQWLKNEKEVNHDIAS